MIKKDRNEGALRSRSCKLRADPVCKDIHILYNEDNFEGKHKNLLAIVVRLKHTDANKKYVCMIAIILNTKYYY